MSKTQYEAFITPAGSAVFPWLTKADTQHDASGVYKTGLAVPFDLAQDLIAKLEKVRDDFVATLPLRRREALIVKPVYTDELTRPKYPEDATDAQKQEIRDNWVGEPTGNALFQMKLKKLVKTADGTTFEQAPIVVDVNGERVEKPVYSDSIIKVKGQIVPYTNAAAGIVGVTLRMKSVQVLDLVTGEGGSGFWTDFDAA